MCVHLRFRRLPLSRAFGQDFVDFVLRSNGILGQILDDERFVVAFEEFEAHSRVDVVAVGEEIEQLLVVQLQIRHADRELGAWLQKERTKNGFQMTAEELAMGFFSFVFF